MQTTFARELEKVTQGEPADPDFVNRLAGNVVIGSASLTLDVAKVLGMQSLPRDGSTRQRQAQRGVELSQGGIV